MAHVANVIIQSNQVAADLTDFPIYIDLSDMPALFWDTVANGGGDIRVYKSDGTTELAREVVSCDTATDTGELHVKYAGTLSGSVDTVIQIHADGTSSEPAADSTYGSEAVWAHAQVLHLQEEGNTTAGGYLDSTANNNNATGVSMTASSDVDAKIGKGQVTDGTADYINLNMPYADADRTYQFWIKADSANPKTEIFWGKQSPTDNDRFYVGLNTANGYFSAGLGADSYNTASATTDNILSTTFLLLHLRYDASADSLEIIINGVSQGTRTDTAAVSTTGSLFLGALNYHPGPTAFFGGTFDEYRQFNALLSNDWIATEYNNQNSPGTFYSASPADSTFKPKIIMF